MAETNPDISTEDRTAAPAPPDAAAMPSPPPDVPARPVVPTQSLTQGPINLSLGIYMGTLIALTLFAGTYSLLLAASRIAVVLFMTGVALGLSGGLLTMLFGDAHRIAQRSAETRPDNPHSPVGSWTALWEGTAVGLGILLGVLPISLACSLLRETALLPWVVYALAGVTLIGVGVVRAPSLKEMLNSIAYALLPGLAGLLVAHMLGDHLRDWVMF